MFIVEIGSVYTTWLAIRDHTSFAIITTIWLWLTVLSRKRRRAVSEGRGKAQAETLRRAKTTTLARRLSGGLRALIRRTVPEQEIARRSCSKAISWWSKAGQFIPGDGTWWRNRERRRIRDH